MKQLFAAAVIAAFGFVGTAMAADMPVKAPMSPITAPVYNWTGFYVGAVGTYGWGDSQHCQNGFAVPCISDWTVHQHEGLGRRLDRWAQLAMEPMGPRC